jgi:hypothetical protein
MGSSRNPTVGLAKWKILVQMSISFFFFNRMVNPYGKFFEPGFPHNFAKKKMIANTKNGLYGCVSTPTTICVQNWGLNRFFDEIMAVLVLP